MAHIGKGRYVNGMYEDATFKIINVGENRINRLNDRFVRYLLAGGRSKPFLIDFINAALMLEDGDRIVDLEIIPGDIHGEDAKTKLSILDVSAKLADGRTIDLEIQIINRHDFKKRGPYYWARRHSMKLLKGKTTYAEIKPTITICLLAFDLLEEEEAYRNTYSVRNDKSGNRLCEDMWLIYLELPKFLRYLGTNHPRTGLERWLLYFSNEEGERMEKVMAEDSVLSEAKGVELAFWADETERELYYRHERLLLDEYSAKHTYDVLLRQEREKLEQKFEQKLEQEVEREREKAEREREKAERERKKTEQAELEKENALMALKEKEKEAQDALRVKLEMAHNLLQLGMGMERVVQISGLSEEEIRENSVLL